MKRFAYILASFALLLASCQKPDDGPAVGSEPPRLVSSSPEDGATGIAGTSLDMVLTFDQNVMCPTSRQGDITIDNGASVSKVNAYMQNVTISLDGLEPGQAYTVVLPEGTVTGYRENIADEIRIGFTMKGEAAHFDLNPDDAPVNPDATAQARKVYSFLLEQSGKKTLSGVQSSSSNTNDFSDLVYRTTGKHPALAGYDFIFLHYSPTPSGWEWKQDYSDISAAKEQWAANGLVNYMWHWNVPNSEADWKKGVDNYDFGGYAFYSSDTSFDINAALTEGTWQHDFIMKDIEELAGYLKLLQDENIPVIWRPLHEAAGNYDKYGSNGAWFWWGRGGAEPCKRLWKLLYGQLVDVYGLNNLIWVWTADITEGCEDQYADWYPGNDYVDIVGADIYASDVDAKTRHYQALVDLTEGRKLVTVSECGNIPDPSACMEAGNRWSWFMVWPGSDSSGNLVMTPSDDNWKKNTETWWKQVLGSPYVINREDMPSLK